MKITLFGIKMMTPQWILLQPAPIFGLMFSVYPKKPALTSNRWQVKTGAHALSHRRFYINSHTDHSWLILFIYILGNIIPAIATTNAVIAGCIVMEALKILNGQFDRCKTVGHQFCYIRRLGD